MDWKLLRIEFKINGRRVNLEDDPSLCHSSVFLKTLLKFIQGVGCGFLVELNNLREEKVEASMVVPKPIEGLLAKYESVLQMPQGLPP